MSGKASNTIKRSRRPSHVWQFIFMIGILVDTIGICHGHGRLIDPPSRSSAFRYGFKTPPNYTDNEVWCGGMMRQQRNGGKCGVCGDAWDMPKPRPNEEGGMYGKGVIVKNYKAGSEITIKIQLTAAHKGYFQFRICPKSPVTQECLDQHVLQLPEGRNNRFYPTRGSTTYAIKARLPSGMKCDHCVLQWQYIAGNNWGMCKNGKGAVGCGPQEEFRGCADVSIGGKGGSKPGRGPGRKPNKRNPWNRG